MGILDISLTSGMRNSLLALTTTSSKIKKTQERLSTGKRVNSALDNPTNFFAAQAHLQRATDLISVKDGITEATQVIKTADIGMNAMTSLFRQASAIADNAKHAINRDELAQMVDQFNEMRNQVDQLTADSGYRGTNLLRRQDLEIDLGNNNTLTIKGADATSSGFDQMTNGLNVEAASMDPLNIVDPNYVTTSGGDIKEDGQLTITNNNIPHIDDWLGATGIKFQAITSQDVTLSNNPSLSDGRTVTSQILDNIGVAEYGNRQFQVYRDKSISISDVYTSSISNINADTVNSYLGYLEGENSKPFTIHKSPDIVAYDTTSSSGSLSPPPTIDDSIKLATYLDISSSNPFPSLDYDSSTKKWSVQSPSTITLIQNGTPPTSFGLDLDGSGVPAVTVNLSGNWNDNDKIQISLSSWSSNDPDLHVMGSGASTNLDIKWGPITDQRTLFEVQLNTAQNNIPADANITYSVNVSSWKTTDSTISLSQPDGTGAMTADLNGDGKDDIQINLPTDGPNGAKWLTSERIQVLTTGPFRTTDSSVALKYNDSAKTVGLYLNGNTSSPDITIALSESWAVNNLSISPFGNGDTINLTVDGRHRWVKGDNKSPNVAGMNLSMQEIEDAINTLRLNSAYNASGMSILSTRDVFINNLASILQTGSDNLTLADMNEEGANMLMLQTQQNLGITSLSIASQASQSVMKMFE